MERLQEATFGRILGTRRSIQSEQFAFDAQQLGDDPSLRGAFGAVDRLFHRREPFRDLPGTAQGFCQLSDENEHPIAGRRGTAFRECGLQLRQSSLWVSPLDEENAPMGAAKSMPEGQGMSPRRVMQEVNILFGKVQITDPQGERACSESQGEAPRLCVIIRFRVLDRAVSHSHRLLWKTL